MTTGIYVKVGGLAAAAGASTSLAQVDFSHTITLGSVLLGVIIAAMALLFTIRSRIATIWHQEATGYREKSERLEKDLAIAARQRAEREQQEQETRHELKDELAACKAQLEVEQAKNDVSLVIERMQVMHGEAMTALTATQKTAVDSVTFALENLGRKLEDGQREQLNLLTEIRDSVKLREEQQ